MFAKLYGADRNQLLVTLDTDDEGKPAIKFSFKPENLGIYSMGVAFPDTDAGWDAAEAMLQGMTEEKARAATAEAMKTCTEMAA